VQQINTSPLQINALTVQMARFQTNKRLDAYNQSHLSNLQLVTKTQSEIHRLVSAKPVQMGPLQTISSKFANQFKLSL